MSEPNEADRERARQWLEAENRGKNSIGIAYCSDVNSLAAEFARVRKEASIFVETPNQNAPVGAFFENSQGLFRHKGDNVWTRLVADYECGQARIAGAKAALERAAKVCDEYCLDAEASEIRSLLNSSDLSWLEEK